MRKASRIILTFSVVVALTTCQLQFNRSAGNNVALRVIVPGSVSSGGKGALGAKDLGGGAILTVLITASNGSQETLSTPINGKSSIDFSFSLSSTGTYQVSVNMLDGSGNLLSTVSTQLTVPTGNYPVVLAMPSNLLSAVLTVFGGNGPVAFPFGFSPTIYSYPSVSTRFPPLTLTLTTVDPNATIALTVNGSAVSPSLPGVYPLNIPLNTPIPIIAVVTGADGNLQSYAITLTYI